MRTLEGSSDLEEATFTIHGIILDKELPPIQRDRYELLLKYLTFCNNKPLVIQFEMKGANRDLQHLYDNMLL